jgi:hypothetical protein
VLSKSTRQTSHEDECSFHVGTEVSQGVGDQRPPLSPQEIQQRIAQGKHHLGGRSDVRLTGILPERHIPNVMHIVLGPPVSTPQPLQFYITLPI